MNNNVLSGISVRMGTVTLPSRILKAANSHFSLTLHVLGENPCEPIPSCPHLGTQAEGGSILNFHKRAHGK